MQGASPAHCRPALWSEHSLSGGNSARRQGAAPYTSHIVSLPADRPVIAPEWPNISFGCASIIFLCEEVAPRMSSDVLCGSQQLPTQLRGTPLRPPVSAIAKRVRDAALCRADVYGGTSFFFRVWVGPRFPDPHELADAVAESVAAAAAASTSGRPAQSQLTGPRRQRRRASPESEGAPPAVLEALEAGPMCDVICHSWGSQALSFLQARYPEVGARMASLSSRLALSSGTAIRAAVSSSRSPAFIRLSAFPSRLTRGQICRRRVYIEPVCFLPGFGHWMRCASHPLSRKISHQPRRRHASVPAPVTVRPPLAPAARPFLPRRYAYDPHLRSWAHLRAWLSSQLDALSSGTAASGEYLGEGSPWQAFRRVRKVLLQAWFIKGGARARGVGWCFCCSVTLPAPLPVLRLQPPSSAIIRQPPEKKLPCPAPARAQTKASSTSRSACSRRTRCSRGGSPARATSSCSLGATTFPQPGSSRPTCASSLLGSPGPCPRARSCGPSTPPHACSSPRGRLPAVCHFWGCAARPAENARPLCALPQASRHWPEAAVLVVPHWRHGSVFLEWDTLGALSGPASLTRSAPDGSRWHEPASSVGWVRATKSCQEGAICELGSCRAQACGTGWLNSSAPGGTSR